MDHRLLNRYLRGECSEAEKDAVERWLREEEELPPVSPQAEDTGAHIWQGLESQINTATNRRAYVPRILLVAGTAAAVVLAAIGMWLHFVGSPHEAEKWTRVDNPAGKLLTITLPDSSIVHLAGGSCISYPSKFADTLREVRFHQGEAYFSVQHDIHRPFRVSTGSSNGIRVLGTQFNLRQRTKDEPLQITLTKGKIAYQTAEKTYVLAPGDQITDSGGKINQGRAANLRQATAWVDGTLWFEDTPIGEVFATLQSHYSITFSGMEHVEAQNITAKFQRQPLDKVLRMLGQSTGLVFARTGNNVAIAKK